MLESIINLGRYSIQDDKYIMKLQEKLERSGVVVLSQFILESIRKDLLSEALQHEHLAYYAQSTHSAYLSSSNNPSYPMHHPINRQLTSSKGCITTDQIPQQSYLKQLYYNPAFQQFCAKVLNVDKLYPYEDPLSEINVHYYKSDLELNWHFDTSSFAITLLLQAPLGGGCFEYVTNLRNSDKEKEYELVEWVLNDEIQGKKLEDMRPGSLVLFRGKDSLHRVTKVKGDQMRVLVVFAYNDKPGVSLSEEARMTFFGRTGE